MKRACFPIRQSAFGSHGIKQPVVPLYPSSLPWKKKRKTAESHRIQPSNAIPLTNTPLTWRWWHLPPRSTLLLLRFGSFFIFSLLRRLTPKPPCFPLKTFLFALYISALSPFALCFSICLFSSPFWFHFLPPSLPLHLPLYSSPSILASLRWRTPPPSSPSPLFVINQGSEQRHSVRGISREADEISGAHLPALYGDLLGWDKQQASHHSQPNRLPACMCLFLLHCHDHCRCQGWSSPRRPAPW